MSATCTTCLLIFSKMLIRKKTALGIWFLLASSRVVCKFALIGNYPQPAALVELESGDQDVDKHAGDEQPDQPFQFQPCALSACHRSVSTGF